MNKRFEYIDILKGFAILCITFLHFEAGVLPLWLNVWIGTFMISAFYFASGWMWGLKDETITVKELVRKRWRSLGVPYLWFTGLILLFDMILWGCGYYDGYFVVREVYKTITLRGIGTLWFLPSLFFGEVIFMWLRNKKSWLLIGGVALMTLLYLYFYYQWSGEYRNLSSLNQIIDAPLYTIRNMMVAWPVVGAGFVVVRYFKRYIANWSSWLIGLLGFAICGVSLYFASFAKLNLGVAVYFLTSVVGPLGWMLVAKMLEGGRMMRFFAYWGRNSLVLMATHYSIVLVLCQIVDRYCFGCDEFVGWRTIVYFVVAVVLTYPLVWFFNNKARFMLGRK